MRSETDSKREWGTRGRAVTVLALGLAATHGLWISPAGGQCIDYEDRLRVTGGVETSHSWPLPDHASFAIQGDYAYLVQGGLSYHDYVSELHVIDLSDPTSLRLVQEIPVLVGGHAEIAVQGDHAYLVGCYADNPYGRCPDLTFARLQVIDISDPESPQIVTALNLEGSFWMHGSDQAIAVSGDYAYIATPRLLIVDISDPALPHLAASVSAGNYTPYRDVIFTDDTLYIGSGALKVVDVSDPASPEIVASVGSGVCSMAFHGQYLICGCREDGIRVFDVSKPTAPQLAGELRLPADVSAITVAGDRAFIVLEPQPESEETVPDWTLGFGVVDLSDPTSPQLVGGSPVPALRPGHRALAARQDQVFVAHRTGLDAFDVTRTKYAHVISSVPLPWGGLDVAVAGNHAFVPGFAPGTLGGSHLRVIDIADPEAPQTVGTVRVHGALSVAKEFGDDYAHVGTGYGYSGVREVYVGDPAGPEVVGGVDLPDPVRDLAVLDGVLFAAAGLLYAIDVSDPLAPVVLGVAGAGFDAEGIVVRDALAYVAAGAAGLRVLGIADPTSLPVLGGIDIGVPVHAVAVEGRFAYVTTGPSETAFPGFYVIDVDDPASPRIEGSVRTHESAFGVVVSGYHAYVAGGGWQIPWRESRFGLLQIVEIGAPDAPRLVGSGGHTSGSVAVAEGLVFVPSPFALTTGPWIEPGLNVCPTQCDPLLVSVPDFSSKPHNGTVLLHPARPNPFRQDTRIGFVLDAPARARLAIYDVGGRLVRILVDRSMSGGDHTVMWDGRDDAGVGVGSGIYFVALSAGEATQTRKVLRRN